MTLDSMISNRSITNFQSIYRNICVYHFRIIRKLFAHQDVSVQVVKIHDLFFVFCMELVISHPNHFVSSISYHMEYLIKVSMYCFTIAITGLSISNIYMMPNSKHVFCLYEISYQLFPACIVTSNREESINILFVLKSM